MRNNAHKGSSMNAGVLKWTRQGYEVFFKRGLPYSIALCLGVSTVPANSVDSLDNSFLYSSAISPDGIWIAENFGTGGCCDGGYVLIHKISEASSRSNASIFSPSPMPGLFVIWKDNENLMLVADSNYQSLIGPTIYRGIAIVYSTYQSRIDFGAANLSKKNLSIKEGDASAETVEETTKTGRRCGLSVSAGDGAIYDEIGMRIEASINRCDQIRDCAGISSKFWIGKRVDGQRGIALTSATVSDIPSYNRLPEGDRNSAVRGDFGESSAVSLIAALSSEAIDIQYSLNFFDVIVSYRIATRQIMNSIKSFKACIGDGDFNWMIREKTKPGSPMLPDK